ncbi:flavodoxin domain-containing protein [Kitasatospora sp. NBC_01266]|uniref:flavodoxin domain-containing protein n=1 Tax=Kitasatospora sp. NBC_01266 TaxID=2903572 RepID=UPI002E311DA0|nr:flavodoxin domain-containing protein [Kitasatospora sp. NBC_01266]
MRRQRVLVAYGSKHGATAGIAEEIGRTLQEDGFEAAVHPASDVRDVEAFDAVILGGSLYAGHWNRDAMRCAHRNAEALTHRPVWLFSSGPVDSSADRHEIPPVPAVAEEMARLHAKEHRTFGGSITAETPGLVARTLVKHDQGGDFRNTRAIQRWAHQVGEELRAGEEA